MAANKSIQMKKHNGTDWDNLYPKTTAEQVITNENNQFVTAAEKNNLTDALPKSGGTMTGALTLATDPGGEKEAATKKYVDTKVAEIVNGSPEVLDTLQELATALGNDPNFATTIATQIGSKLAANEVVTTATANKVLRLDATGKLVADVMGKAATATKLASAIKINGVPFDGSADIAITQVNEKNIATVDQIPVLTVSATEPTGAKVGDIWYEEMV